MNAERIPSTGYCLYSFQTMNGISKFSTTIENIPFLELKFFVSIKMTR